MLIFARFIHIEGFHSGSCSILCIEDDNLKEKKFTCSLTDVKCHSYFLVLHIECFWLPYVKIFLVHV
jgi:hypothetical protein